MAGDRQGERSVGSPALRWGRSDLAALAGLVAFWMLKSAAIFGNFSQRHFAMRLSIHDLLSQYWSTWWIGRSLTGLARSIHFCPVLNYPVGADYFGAQPNYLQELLAGWLHMKWGGVAAANSVALAVLLFSLLSFYVLFRHLARSRALGFALSILVGSYSLFFDNQLLDLSLTNAGFFALALHFWLRTLEEPGWRLASGAVLCAALTGLGHLYHGAMLLGIWTLALPFAARGRLFAGLAPRRPALHTALILLAGVVSVVAVLWGPLALIRGVGGAQEDLPSQVIRRLAEWELWLGGLALAALAVAIWLLRARGAWFWFACTASLYVFALGDSYPSTVQQGIGGGTGSGPIVLPLGWLLRTIPFGWRFTHPDRLALAGLVSAGCLGCVLWRRFAATQFLSPFLATPLRKTLVFVAALYLILPHLGASATFRMPGSMTQLSTSGGRPLTGFRDPNLAHLVCGAGPASQAAPAPREKAWKRYLWVFQPLEYFLLPPIPQVLSDLGSSTESFAVMEVSGFNPYFSQYFQTAHGKGIGGYHQPPHLVSSHPPSPLTLAQEKVDAGEFSSLSLARLQAMAVRYVVRYQGAHLSADGNWCPALGQMPWAVPALTAPHLRLVHDDPMVQVWEVELEGTSP